VSEPSERPEHAGDTDDYPRPAPSPVGLNAEWYRHLADGELRFQQCDSCGTWRHPPRVLCAACGSSDWTWARSAGLGTIFSWTVTHQALHPSFADVVPYAIVVVELDEGPRIVCSVRDLANDELTLDLPVVIGLAPVDDAIALPYARPRDPSRRSP
jgi:uncharacterized OB-fold protein